MRNFSIDGLTAEHGILMIFLTVSVYIFIGSYELGDRAAAFPRFTSSVAIVIIVLLLFREYIPAPFDKLVKDSGDTSDPISSDISEDVTETKESEGQQGETKAITTDEAMVNASERRFVKIYKIWLDGALYTALMTFGFVILAYVAGMLWAAPVFVAAFLIGMRRPWYLILLLTLMAFVAAFAFYWVLRLDIASGALVDLEPLLLELLDILGID